ncbi:transposase [Corynebacterium falsenii]|uniref:transposase n=1 Tax=Corynebacterium falsenii TaxID=108486 RepID=UPI003FD66889
MPKQFSPETKRRAVRLVEEHISANACSIEAACKAVSPKIDISYHTLRNWLKASRVSHQSTGEMSGEELAYEVAQLLSRLREMESAKEILKAASAFFAKKLVLPGSR